MGKHSQCDNVDIGENKKEVIPVDKPEDFVQSKTLCQCSNTPIEPCGREGFVVIKAPVVLAEFKVEINSECKIKFDQPAVEILRVKKNVYLTECRLLPAAQKLFIKGYVRKNIEYAAKSKEGKGGNSIRYITLESPFFCTTLVKYFIKPEITKGVEKCCIENCSAEFKPEEGLKLELENTECLTEKIYCEIVKAQVFDLDIAEDEKSKDKENQRLIQELDEKLVISITLRLLQKQEINIYGAKAIKKCQDRE